jgi:hypothetical protein
VLVAVATGGAAGCATGRELSWEGYGGSVQHCSRTVGRVALG